MATYLELVNKVIDESASEKDELTSLTWATAEAGRRIYPRIKRNVADAWKLIQMKRNDWSFMTSEMNTTVYPRVRVTNGTGTSPVAGTVFTNSDGYTLTVRQVFLESGTWGAGTAVANIEFTGYTGNRFLPATVFVNSATSTNFTYLEKGSYSFLEIDPLLREIQWATFSSSWGNNYSESPVRYIPWDNWFYKNFSFTSSSQSGPAYVSQDFAGNVVFYPQTLNPFRVSFVYGRSPQILSLYTDVPLGLPAEYHDWIAWEALMKYALFDKNADLYAYAKEQAKTYSTKAEANLMPLMSYVASPYNRG